MWSHRYGHLGLKVLGVLTIINGPSGNDAAIRHLTGVEQEAVVKADWEGSTYRPGYDPLTIR